VWKFRLGRFDEEERINLGFVLATLFHASCVYAKVAATATFLDGCEDV